MLFALAVTVAACSAAEEASPTGGQAGEDDPLSLVGVCPDPVVFQSTWYSQVEHFVAFEVLGEGYTPDPDAHSVTGPLVAGGVPTGIGIEIRAGGPAVGFNQVSAQMYLDEGIHIGMVPTDQIIQNSADQPLIAVMAPFDRSLFAVIWSPEEHPEFNVIADIGQTDTTVLYREGSTYMDYLTGSGLLRESQLDSGYDAGPAQFVASGGTIAVGAFGTSEPYRWSNDLPGVWNRPLEFQWVADTGYPDYANALVVRSGDLEELAPCLERLVPIFQQATADFLQDPEPTIARIHKVVEETAQEYDDSPERSRSAVELMRTDLLVAGGDDGVIGSFDMDRIEKLFDIVEPVFRGQGTKLRDGLTPEDIATNRFIDTSISLPAAAAASPAATPGQP